MWIWISVTWKTETSALAWTSSNIHYGHLQSPQVRTPSPCRTVVSRQWPTTPTTTLDMWPRSEYNSHFNKEFNFNFCPPRFPTPELLCTPTIPALGETQQEIWNWSISGKLNLICVADTVTPPPPTTPQLPTTPPLPQFIGGKIAKCMIFNL